MKRILHIIAAAVWLLVAQVCSASQAVLPKLLVVHGDASKASVQSLKAAQGVEWWLEFADALVLAAPEQTLQTLRVDLKHLATQEFSGIDPRFLALHGRGCDHDVQAFPERVLYDGGRWSLVQMAFPVILPSRDWSIRPLVKNTAVTFNIRHSKGTPVPDPEIQAVVDLVDPDRWFADVETLAAWDRHSNNAELALARDWLVDQFSAMPGVASVDTEAFLVNGQTAWNVIATVPGAQTPDQWIIVGGHYDSRRASSSSLSPTPGAEDNASGCSGVLEMARIINDRQPRQTMLFMCYSGEEQGLIGSFFNAAQLDGNGDLDKVQLMLNMDMIGYSGDSDLDVLLETNSDHLNLITLFGDAAETYTNLRSIGDQFACCSDHVPYLNRNVPALLTIENDYSSYPHYHRQTDVPANITRALEMGGGVLRMNIAVLAQLTGIRASQDLIFLDSLEALATP